MPKESSDFCDLRSQTPLAMKAIPSLQSMRNMPSVELAFLDANGGIDHDGRCWLVGWGVDIKGGSK